MYKMGGFTIYGDHEDDPGGLSIKLFPYTIMSYPWWSESTQKVLTEMHKLPIKGATVLDLGCGASAILTLAAYALGADKVVACENNSIQANVAAKQIEGKENISLLYEDTDEKYDIIISNLGEADIIEKLKKRAKHGICTSMEGEILRW